MAKVMTMAKGYRNGFDFWAMFLQEVISALKPKAAGEKVVENVKFIFDHIG